MLSEYTTPGVSIELDDNQTIYSLLTRRIERTGTDTVIAAKKLASLEDPCALTTGFEMPTIAAHCIRVSESDRAILSQNDVSVVTNPASNMKLGNGFAPVPEMMAAGINVCLGTDGAASNNAQNMFREMGLLALIHKGTHDTPQCISAHEVLDMATRNGAKALGLDTGSIEVGKKADLALLDLDAPSLTPLNNPVAALAYSANGSEVTDVIIDGRPVMRDRQLLTIDEERVRSEIARICERLGLAQMV